MEWFYKHPKLDEYYNAIDLEITKAFNDNTLGDKALLELLLAVIKRLIFHIENL